MKYMQFVGIGKLIDIVCENKNYINFVTEADVIVKINQIYFYEIIILTISSCSYSTICQEYQLVLVMYL